MRVMKSILLSMILVLIFSCSNFKDIHEERILKIGHEIINNPPQKGSLYKHPEILIRKNLSAKLVELTDSMSEYQLRVKTGDFSEPYGDNKADCFLIIDTDYKDIGIRLKYEKKYDKYDVLGYMTLVDL